MNRGCVRHVLCCVTYLVTSKVSHKRPLWCFLRVLGTWQIFFGCFLKSRCPPGAVLHVCLDSKVWFLLFIKEVRDSLWLSLPFCHYFRDVCIQEMKAQHDTKWLSCHFGLGLSLATKGPSHWEMQELNILRKTNNAASCSLSMMLRCPVALKRSLYIQLKENHCPNCEGRGRFRDDNIGLVLYN